MTELYRLQRQQTLAALDSERLDSIEAGWLHASERFEAEIAAFALSKRNVILRDANAFNVSDGRTRHRGIEYGASFRLTRRLSLGANGSFARHRYDFDRAIEGGETIVSGRDVDTAPRGLHGLRLVWEAERLAAELEALRVGRYFLDASNTASYPGHTLLNLRFGWEVAPRWQLTFRATNLADERYADRADFAFGEYRYFPGRGRSAYLEIAWASLER
jgi:outer membrane receptor protein involved in Fe transport